MNTPHKLPQFDGWTVDERLEEFRKADPARGLESVPFQSTHGEYLLRKLLREMGQAAGCFRPCVRGLLDDVREVQGRAEWLGLDAVATLFHPIQDALRGMLREES